MRPKGRRRKERGNETRSVDGAQRRAGADSGRTGGVRATRWRSARGRLWYIVVNPGDYPGSCDFPFSLDCSGKGKTIRLPDGSLILTSPGLDVTITNLDAPENEATFNVTGSIHQSTLEDGSVVTVLTGRNFVIDPEAGTTDVVGRFIFDANGTLIQPQIGTGQRIDICALLS